MMIKLFDGTIKDDNSGVIIEGGNAGQYSFFDNPLVKEYQENEQWISNPGYNLSKAKDREINFIDRKLIMLELQKSKANELTFAAQSSVFSSELTTLNSRKAFLEALT